MFLTVVDLDVRPHVLARPHEPGAAALESGLDQPGEKHGLHVLHAGVRHAPGGDAPDGTWQDDVRLDVTWAGEARD